MKINRYKLKSNIATNDLIKLNAREGGIWINKESKLFLSKCFYYEPYEFEFSIGIAFLVMLRIALNAPNTISIKCISAINA